MGKCKYCGRSGLFFSVNREGLCSSCVPIVVRVLESHTHVINDCRRLIDESKNTRTKLSRCDLLLERASILYEEYEQKGIEVLEPSPSELIQKYTAMREQIVIDGLEAEYKMALAKVEVATTIKSKINTLSKVLMKLQEFKPKVKNATLLDPLERRIKKKIHQTQLDSFISEAKKAEFKGQNKKALDKYFEALYFLRNDKIDDSLQENNIMYIETKIKELGGNIQE